jgi:chromosome segregation protein
MIQFSKLRISGFKSFVDRTELDIGMGLNGVVGPNGCGKSNLVEALRWVMGENSAKRMRGGGMEDVIFNGTESRPARNLAEVSILLDNSTRSAPAAYNESDEIEIIRRIEKDHGSTYRINGKVVRARDVQMLFADTVTGANSPAMVSQGRVAQIINAKPYDRRMILEESAGISGLYARRHEAELRLRAAEGNMQRLDDLMGGMEQRLNDLKRQARQATRYRNVTAQIRQMEILIAWLEWRTLEKRMDHLREAFAQSESAVNERMIAVSQLTVTQTTRAQDLPPLRQNEAEIAAALQHKKIALQRLEDEAERHGQSVREAEEQMEQSIIDLAHESDAITESSVRMERLEREQSALAAEQGNDEGRLEEKESARNELEQKVIQLEEQYASLMRNAAETRARKQSLEQQIKTNSERMESITARKTKAEQDLAELSAANEATAHIARAENAVATFELESLNASDQFESLAAEIEQTQIRLNQARTAFDAASSKKHEFNAELAMLENMFKDEGDSPFIPALSRVNADSGFEKALSRALGDALLAGLEDNAPARWRMRTAPRNMPSLPSGVESLLPKIKAPPELHLALSQIGLVRSDSEGEAMVEKLSPGQALVSPDGTYWRWDGYTIKASAADRNALHLEQKNRLESLRARAPALESDFTDKESKLNIVKFDLEALEGKRKSLSADIKSAAEKLNAARAALGMLREGRAKAESEQARLNDLIRLSDEDLKTLEEVTRWDRERLKAYEQDSIDKKEEDTEKLRQTLIETRDAYNAAVRAYDTFQQQQNSRSARLHAIADERVNLQNRLIRSRERVKQLEIRKDAVAEKLKDLKNQPQDFAEEKELLMSAAAELEKSRSIAADELLACENEVADLGKALKESELKLAEARESRAGAQATLAALEEQRTGLEQNITEQFSVKPNELPMHASINPETQEGEQAESLDDLRVKKEKLIRERDNIGAVNLRADEEALQLETEVSKMVAERTDLGQAIEELRGGINKINKEARERLLTAFEHVNTHFQRLFIQLFGGGQAHLKLIDSDENSKDPLGAGLEIFAQPPGKTLQSLSLLSGGEQALASISLIFAMFLTNPSPICVLDEIDAPLDDANVDRVCNLLEEIAARGETRFLVITHHRLTMARMNRLYGVTMAERGVSQLVSVDLQRSFEFLEAA